MMLRLSARHAVVVAALLTIAPVYPASAVSIDWVAVGAPGNAADDTGYGSVASVYRISKTEVTNAQYAEFLNAVGRSDPNGLYYERMSWTWTWGGIVREGTSGSYTYSVIDGRGDKPVNWVSWYDAARFANWLHNGQPVGPQDATTTEDGAYTITQTGIDENSITRNANARIFLPSEGEWYKAAYFDVVTATYFDYPSGTDTETTCAMPGATSNTANCYYAVNDLTDAGSYLGAASPNGTFDQGGNVWEWTETLSLDSAGRIVRGGSLDNPAWAFSAEWRTQGGSTGDLNDLGFRVASIPEPGTSMLLLAGLLGLAGMRHPEVARSLPHTRARQRVTNA